MGQTHRHPHRSASFAGFRRRRTSTRSLTIRAWDVVDWLTTGHEPDGLATQRCRLRSAALRLRPKTYVRCVSSTPEGAGTLRARYENHRRHLGHARTASLGS